MKNVFKKLMAVLFVLTLGLSLSACSSSNTTTETSAKYTAGTYTGVGTGNNGDVEVSVVVSDSAITSVEVTKHAEPPGIADPALEQIPAAIVEAQSADVDVVSGATNTSNAIIEAVKSALAEAAK